MPAAVDWIMDAGISMPSVIGEIAGPYREFAEMVRQIVGERSLRQAQIKTGVSHTTIGDMMKGIRPKEATIRLFAAGFDTASEDLLRAAGYPVRSLPAIPKTRETAPAPYSPADAIANPLSSGTLTSSDPLRLIGSEIDPAPFIAALRDVRGIGANVEKLKDPDAPGEDVLIGPVRAFRVEGDCMKPYLEEGDEILVLPAKYARDGELVTATVNLGAITCKQIRIEEGRSWLEPVNGEGRIEEGDFTVTGVVFRVISDPIKLIERRREREKK